MPSDGFKRSDLMASSTCAFTWRYPRTVRGGIAAPPGRGTPWCSRTVDRGRRPTRSRVCPSRSTTAGSVAGPRDAVGERGQHLGGARPVDEHVEVDVDGATAPLGAPRERERASERVRDFGVVERRDGSARILSTRRLTGSATSAGAGEDGHSSVAAWRAGNCSAIERLRPARVPARSGLRHRHG